MTRHYCCVRGCGGDARKNSKLKFFCIPRKSEVCRMWVKLISRSRNKTLNVTRNTRICERHFVDGKPTRENPFPTLQITRYDPTQPTCESQVYDLAELRKKTKLAEQRNINALSLLSEVSACASYSTTPGHFVNRSSTKDNPFTTSHLNYVPVCPTHTQKRKLPVYDIAQLRKKTKLAEQRNIKALSFLSEVSDCASYTTAPTESDSRRDFVSVLTNEEQQSYANPFEDHKYELPPPSPSRSEMIDMESVASTSTHMCLFNKQLSSYSMPVLNTACKYYEVPVSFIRAPTGVPNAMFMKKIVFGKIRKEICKRKREFFGIEKVKSDDTMMSFYTTLKNYAVFKCLFRHIDKELKTTEYSYYYRRYAKIPWYRKKYLYLHPWSANKLRQADLLDLEDEFFLVLVKLRLNLFNKDLACRFGISTAKVSVILNTWLPFLRKKLQFLIFMPNDNMIYESMPACFEDYPRTKMILNYSETVVKRPSTQKARARLWSSKKHNYTIKCLFGMTPTGMISCQSKVWGGSTSDNHIMKMSRIEILDKLQFGESVMAVKDLDVYDILNLNGVTLNITPSMRMKKKMCETERNKKKKITRLRSHIEKLNRRIQVFYILNGTLSKNMLRHANSILTICSALVNVQEKLVI